MTGWIWLMRARRWLAHPPSGQRMRLIVAVFAVIAAIALLEWAGLWPDSLTLDRTPRMVRP